VPAVAFPRNVRRRRWKELSTAGDAHAAPQVVRVTHPFHPLFGRSFELLTRRKAWGEDRVFFYEGEHLRAVPASWTDAEPAPVFVTVGAGRAHFRPEDLWRLAALVEELMGSRETSPAARRSTATPGPKVLRPPEKVSRKLR